LINIYDKYCKTSLIHFTGYENISDDANIFAGTKRKKQGQPNTPPTVKKQKVSTPKNALMVLNEKQPGLSYNVASQTGPVHAPTFVISVEIEGQTFTGSGTSKKAARLEAAQNACNALSLEFVS
jgi:dsRNA-specific ribonuclease